MQLNFHNYKKSAIPLSERAEALIKLIQNRKAAVHQHYLNSHINYGLNHGAK